MIYGLGVHVFRADPILLMRNQLKKSRTPSSLPPIFGPVGHLPLVVHRPPAIKMIDVFSENERSTMTYAYTRGWIMKVDNYQWICIFLGN